MCVLDFSLFTFIFLLHVMILLLLIFVFGFRQGCILLKYLLEKWNCSMHCCNIAT